MESTIKRNSFWKFQSDFYHIFLILALILLRNELLVVGLKMDRVLVPESGIYGGIESLRCDFEPEGDRIFSVKWYKDEHEFFSYRPKATPQFQYYNLSGFEIIQNATMNEITIRNLTLRASGNYKCEVSADSPSYRTLSDGGNLTVVVLPDPLYPRINNISSSVLMGTTIVGNCTSFRSYPPPQLTFYINGQKASDSDVVEYGVLGGSWVRWGERMDLFTSTLGLRLKINSSHFVGGVIKLRCVSSLGKLNLSSDLLLTHQNHPLSTYSSYGRSNSGSKLNYGHGKIFILLSIILICMKIVHY